MNRVLMCTVVVGLFLPPPTWAQPGSHGIRGLRPDPDAPSSRGLSRYPDVQLGGVRWRVASDSVSGQEPKARITLDTSDDLFTSQGFSPDGKTLATACLGAGALDSGTLVGTIKLWDVMTGRKIATFGPYTGLLSTIAFSPDGRTLAVGEMDNKISLWDVASGKTTAGFRADSGDLASMAFSPDGKTLASAGRDKTITLWDVATGKSRVLLQGHSAASLSPFAFSPDGKTLASCGIRTINDQSVATISLWEVATGKNKANMSIPERQYRFSALAFSPNGRTLASGRGNGGIELWDASTGRVTASLEGHACWVRSLAFARDGMILASGSQDSAVKLWNIASGTSIAIQAGDGTCTFPSVSDPCLAFALDAKALVWAKGEDKALVLWDVRTVQKGAKHLKGPAGHTR